MTGNRLAGFMAALGVGLGLAASSSAALITWEFEAQLESLAVLPTDPFGPDEITPALTSMGVQVGASVTGRVVFESSTPDAYPETLHYASYPDALVLSELSIGTYALRSDLYQGALGPSPRLFFANTSQGPRGFLSTLDFLGGEIGQPLTSSVEFSLELVSPDLALFESATESLPTDPPALVDLVPYGFDPNAPSYVDGSRVSLYGNTNLGRFMVTASFARLERVPGPALLGLLAPLAVVIVAARQRRVRA